MKKIISYGVVLSIVAPFVAFAADVLDIINTITRILDRVMPVLITIAVIYFVWGVIQYTVAQDEEKKKKARGAIIQGLIGLFIIVAFWGILNVVENTFHVGPSRLNPNAIPCVPSPNAGIVCP
jgi:hypothetical protein